MTTLLLIISHAFPIEADHMHRAHTELYAKSQSGMQRIEFCKQ